MKDMKTFIIYQTMTPKDFTRIKDILGNKRKTTPIMQKMIRENWNYYQLWRYTDYSGELLSFN